MLAIYLSLELKFVDGLRRLSCWRKGLGADAEGLGLDWDKFINLQLRFYLHSWAFILVKK